MLRQTEKGVQSELGRSQGKGHEGDVVVLFVGGLVEVWRAAWIAVYIMGADLKGRDRGEEAFSGKIRHNILHASRKTGEAVKRLSNVRHMPETKVPSPHSVRAGTARQGRGRTG